MKIYNLPRGAGKSMRMLYASELTSAPILCVDNSARECLVNKARCFGIKIPRPITVHEFIIKAEDYYDLKRVLIDEALIILQEMIKSMSKRTHTDVIAVTLSDDYNAEMVRDFDDYSCKDMKVEELGNGEKH